MIEIDAAPVSRLVDVQRNRAGRLSGTAASVLSTAAIELEHAIEEGRQNALMRQAALDALVSREPDECVRIPPAGIALDEIERQALLVAMRMSQGVQQDAAALLRISPRVLNYKIQILRRRGRWPVEDGRRNMVMAARQPSTVKVFLASAAEVS